MKKRKKSHDNTQESPSKSWDLLGPNSGIRRLIAWSSDFMDQLEKLALIYLVAVILIVCVFGFSTRFLPLPDEERTLIAGFLTTIFTIIVVPFSLSRYDRLASHRFEIAKENISLYVDLCKILIAIMESKSLETEKLFERMEGFIKKHRAEITLLFPSEIASDLTMIYYELKHKSITTARTYSRHLIKKIRIQLDVHGKYHLPADASDRVTSGNGQKAAVKILRKRRRRRCDARRKRAHRVDSTSLHFDVVMRTETECVIIRRENR